MAAQQLVAPPELPVREEEEDTRRRNGTSVRLLELEPGVKALESRGYSQSAVVRQLVRWGLLAMQQAGAPELAGLDFGPVDSMPRRAAPRRRGGAAPRRTGGGRGKSHA
jgi:hypothetical protein